MVMIGTVNLGVKITTGHTIRRRLEHFDFDRKLKDLKEEAAKDANRPSHWLELIHHGRILNEEKSLKESGIKSGEIVYVLQKLPEDEPEVQRRITEIEVQECVAFFRTFRNPGESAVSLLLVLRDNAHSESFLASMPGLRNDPVAINFLREPDLLAHMGDPDTIRRLADRHPALIEAVREVSGFKDHSLPNSRNFSSLRSAEFDEDEEVDIIGDTDDDGDGSGTEANQSGVSIITHEQLSSALALAEMAAGNSTTGTRSSNSTADDTGLREFLGSLLATDRPSSSTSGSYRPYVTPDMFNNALSQALTTATAGNSSTPDASTSAAMESTSSDENSNLQKYATQLQKLQEMGLTNNAVNIRALIISDGDVNRAINLVLSDSQLLNDTDTF